MKKQIPFQKDLIFKTKISEITSISLVDNLDMVSSNLIKGEFKISGDYKESSISIREEPFLYNVPFTYELEQECDPKETLVDVVDFYYEIIKGEILRVNIELEVSGVLLKPEVVTAVRGDITDCVEAEVLELEPEVAEPVIKEEPEPEERPVINEEKLKSLFDSFSDQDETFSTYHVYIVQSDDTIETIMNKYQITKEELQLYNNIEVIKQGTKIIIPTHTHEQN